MNIQKKTYQGGVSKGRLHIKSFKYSEDAHGFLNKQHDNNWSIAEDQHQDKKAGIYAYAGGIWHNVKKLDPSVLAHI